MTFMEALPMIVFLLLIVLLIVLIILGIKLICVVDKTEKMLDDVQNKIDSFNGVFNLVDIASEKLNIGISSLVDGIINLVGKLFKKRKDIEDYE